MPLLRVDPVLVDVDEISPLFPREDPHAFGYTRG
jgi:hypothetical protein